METREQLQAQLDEDRLARAEMDMHLVDARAELQDAMQRLQVLLKSEAACCDAWEVADAAIDECYSSYQHKLVMFRAARAAIESLDERIQDAIRTLADAELWKEATL